jgi:hypothetical protein
MAVPLSSLRDTLDRIVLDDPSFPPTTWAVYAICNHAYMTWEVTEIIPWYERGGGDGNTLPPFKITDCRDEIDAYKKFMEQTR